MPIIIGVLLILLDQITKYLYVNVFGAKDIIFIKNIINFTYVENRGAAWGLFADNQIWLYVFSGILVAVMIFAYIHYNKKMNLLMKYSFAITIAGAIGNMIDRLAFGYVRDMIQFAFITFPVFNVADSSITIGGILLVFDCLFGKGKQFFIDSDSSVKCSDKSINSKSSLDSCIDREKSEHGYKHEGDNVEK